MSDIENLPLTIPVFREITFPPNNLPNGFKRAVVDHVIDGDSVWLYVDLEWNGIHDHKNCRMMGIQAPDHQPAKTVSKAHLANYLYPQAEIIIYVPDWDKYGRPLVAVYVPGLDITLNQYMLDQGYAVPYDGKGPKPDTGGQDGKE